MIKLLTKDTSTKYKRGLVLKSNNYGNFRIVGQIDEPVKKGGRNYYPWYLIEFEDKTRVRVNVSNLSRGRVVNFNKKTICGIGFIGEGKHKPFDNKAPSREYIAWKGMLYRCYYNTHNYIGCTVNERWHNFQNFCNDIRGLKGYELWKDDKNYQLDKDIKIKSNKEYSKDLCIFVHRKENTKDAISRKSERIRIEWLRMYRERKLIGCTQVHYAKMYECSLNKVRKAEKYAKGERDEYFKQNTNRIKRTKKPA